MRHAASYKVISLHLADAIFLIYFHNDSSKLTTTTSFIALRTRTVFTLGSARRETTLWCEAVLHWNVKHTTVVKVRITRVSFTRHSPASSLEGYKSWQTRCLSPTCLKTRSMLSKLLFIHQLMRK